MFTLNITFVMPPQVETQFREWLTSRFSPLCSINSPLSARLQKVVEIGGEAPGPEHGLSIALQVDFPDKPSADAWSDSRLPEILGSFMAQFGPGAAYFTTLLESSSFI